LQLKKSTDSIANYFLSEKIQYNDRISGVLPNIPETIISFLASAKIGAVWSSCSADFGPNAIIDRFKQIKPKILIVTDCYYYNGKKYNVIKKIQPVLKEIKSIKKIIVIPYDGKKISFFPKFKYINWNKIKNYESKNIIKKLFRFNHPLYILYSSGTTGKPKCIVHGAGGSLIQHLKEHQLHCNIKKNDVVFYFTTCGWMMWNWLVSVLASNARIILYDGSPFSPKKSILFDIIDKEKITFFGTGAKYIDAIKNENIKFIKTHKLKSLKTLASTGSPLSHESFLYIYKNVKKNIHLTSISGGTDIVSCFVLGNPNEKVYPGEIQCKGLGMEVDVFNKKGKSIKNKKGELVCKSPFPSKPLFFWNDKNNFLYKKSYFSQFHNVWYHGDFAKITKNNGIIIYGRSDTTLNSGGVRIGTAEIYRIVENINQIFECLVTEKEVKNDTKIIMFVKMNKNCSLNNKLKNQINNKIKKLLSTKHVPKKIIKVMDIPKTKSGKVMELVIKQIINGKKIDNIESLTNPECIAEYKNNKELINL
tara:strand:+ start:1974 stop:3575 length:1602 start_codon:yes stop_codon:yes gene_type:complete